MSALASTPSATNRDDVHRFRAFLDESGFTAVGVRDLLQAGNELLSSPYEVAVHRRRLRHLESRLSTLVELFVLRTELPRERAERQLAPLGLDTLAALGLASLGDDDVVARLRIVPHDELLLASDLPDEKQPDHVAAAHRPSATLANLTVRRRVATALDVGTGNGIQALLLARHADRVVATDVNERALAFAEFNAALNGVENIEFRAGSFLEPVAGERFDLVVANPPYVVSPENEFVFRDSGLGRDRVSEELVRALPSVLAEGASATVMVSWIESGEQLPRPAEWLRDSGCDAFILQTPGEDALTGASAWNRNAGSAEEHAERFERWADYYEAEGIEKLGYAAIVLRRRDGDNWVRALELPGNPLTPASAHVERLFAAQDFLEAAPELLETRVAFAPGVRLEQGLEPRAEAWVVHETTLSASEGLAFRVGLDTNAARIVTALRPANRLGEVLAGVAGEIGADPEAVRRAGAELVRRLLQLGLVTPA